MSEEVSLIARIVNKFPTGNNNILLEVEGSGKKEIVVVDKGKKSLFRKVKDLVVNDVVKVIGVMSVGLIMAREVSPIE